MPKISKLRIINNIKQLIRQSFCEHTQRDTIQYNISRGMFETKCCGCNKYIWVHPENMPDD